MPAPLKLLNFVFYYISHTGTVLRGARTPQLDRRQAEEPQDQEPKHGLAHRVERHEIPLGDLRVPRAPAELLDLLAEEEEW